MAAGLSGEMRQRIRDALVRLTERAAREVPDAGTFDPIVESVAIEHPAYPIGRVTLRIGPGQGEGETRRFLDVRVQTASGGSESSSFTHFLPKADLCAALAEEAAFDAVLTAVESSVQSLRWHQLR